MGVLDNVFAGSNGVSALLHRTLGGTAVIRVVSGYTRDENGFLTPTYNDYQVPFVPADVKDEKKAENAPGAGRTDVRVPLNEIAGSFACASLSETIAPERDSLILNGVSYTITSVDTLKVGDADVQYYVRARRG